MLRRIHLLGQDLMLMDDGKIMRNHCLAQENTLVMKRALPIDFIIASKKNKHAGKNIDLTLT